MSFDWLPSYHGLQHQHCICILEWKLARGHAHGLSSRCHRATTQLQWHNQRLWPQQAFVWDEVQHHYHTVQEWMCGQRQSHKSDHNRQGRVDKWLKCRLHNQIWFTFKFLNGIINQPGKILIHRFFGITCFWSFSSPVYTSPVKRGNRLPRKLSLGDLWGIRRCSGL